MISSWLSFVAIIISNTLASPVQANVHQLQSAATLSSLCILSSETARAHKLSSLEHLGCEQLLIPEAAHHSNDDLKQAQTIAANKGLYRHKRFCALSYDSALYQDSFSPIKRLQTSSWFANALRQQKQGENACPLSIVISKASLSDPSNSSSLSLFQRNNIAGVIDLYIGLDQHDTSLLVSQQTAFSNLNHGILKLSFHDDRHYLISHFSCDDKRCNASADWQESRKAIGIR